MRRTTAVVCLAAAVGAVGVGSFAPKMHRSRPGRMAHVVERPARTPVPAPPTAAPAPGPAPQPIPAPESAPAPAPEPPPPAPTWSGTVDLQVYGPDGSALTWSAFRARQSNGRGDAGTNDDLVDPDTLVVLAGGPLRPGDGTTARFDLPGRPASLSLAWPTSLGYSTVIVDLPGTPGRQVFNVLAARSLVAELDRVRRSGPVPALSGVDLDRPAVLLEQAEQALRAGDERAAAAAADQSMDAATIAITELAAAQGAILGRGREAVIAGVTFDRPDVSPEEWDAALGVLGDRGRRWVRVVLDRETEPDDYREFLDEAARRGVSVLAQLLDSSEMADLTREEWRQRLQTFVDGLPGVAAWEVGNEVNGSWLGDPAEVAARVAEAAAYVRERTDAEVMVTLYWQLGEEAPRQALFNWLAAHPEAVARADLVGLSIYPGEHPLGSGVERVLRTLEAAVGARPVVIAELGYGSPDLDRIWWWGSPDDPTGTARRAVASLYQRVAMRRGGGAFWWYFLQEVPGDAALRSTLAAAVAAGR